MRCVAVGAQVLYDGSRSSSGVWGRTVFNLPIEEETQVEFWLQYFSLQVLYKGNAEHVKLQFVGFLSRVSYKK